MNNDDIFSRIISCCVSKGFQVKIISSSCLEILRDRIYSIEYELSKIFFNERLTFFHFDIPADFPSAKSIILVASPQFPVKVHFYYNGKLISSLVPPTYSYHTDIIAKDIIENLISPYNYSLSDIQLPVKILAVLSGMAQYGKNNITYISGMGSFFRLKGFYTNIESSTHLENQLLMMEECKICNACRLNCPSGAILENRFLISAERCLTFLNERPEAFPDWVNPLWHNCLIGCMKCQYSCPVNKKFKNRFEGEIYFTEDETQQIINETPFDELNAVTMGKLTCLNLQNDHKLLPRNLRALILKEKNND